MQRLFQVISISFLSFQLNAQSWDSLNKKVIEFVTAGQMDSANSYGEKALKKAETDFGKKHQNYFRALWIMGMVVDMSGDFAKAEPFYLQALTVQKEISGEKDEAYINALSEMAATYRNQNNLPSAISYLLQVNDLRLQVSGANSAAYAKSLENLGAAYDDNGDYNKADPLFLECRDIRKKLFGESHPAYASILNNIALLYNHTGRYLEAVALYKESLKIKKASTGETNADYGVSLSNLATLYCDMGDYDKAEPLFLQALKIDEKEFGADSPEYARSLNNLATYYYDLNETDKAKDYFLRALAINRRMWGIIHEEVAVLLHNLGQLYQRTGEFDKAEDSYMEAIEIREKALGKEHPRFLGSVIALGGLYYQQQKLSEAEQLYNAALPGLKRSLGETHPTYGLALNNLASIYMETKRYKESENLLLNALAISEKNLFDPKLSDYFNNLAMVYRHLGNDEKTDLYFKKALKNTVYSLRKNFAFLSEKEKEKFVAGALLDFNGYQSFHLDYSNKNPSAAGTAYNIELTAKGMILNAGIEMQQAILNSGSKEAIALYDKWALLKASIAKEYSLPQANRKINLVAMENAANDYEHELVRLSSSFRDILDLGSTDWRQIRQALKNDEVAVEFASFRYRKREAWTDSTVYIALVLRKIDSFPHLIPLCEEKQLDSLLSKPQSTNEVFISALYRGLEGKANQSGMQSRRLFQLIWKPMNHLLKPGDKIYFAPSGILNQIAFAAMPLDSLNLVSDKYKLEQLRSTAMLIKERATKTGKAISLYGGIQYTMTEQEMAAISRNNKNQPTISRSLTKKTGEDVWNYLPGTLKEVNAISAAAAKNNFSATVYQGKAATEDLFKAKSGSQAPSILHIATHGFFFPDPQKEKINTGYDTEENFRNADNPLNRSGIILAGANRAWNDQPIPEGAEDGILTAYEVGNLYLGSTQLVVLSACETGLGDIKGSEGVFGLQRSFKLAGVEYLMMSLWKVPDAETAEFMEYFYTNLFAGKTIPQSFTATQDFMKKKYPKQPYKWAAFILVR